jgi:hypothetical protein
MSSSPSNPFGYAPGELLRLAGVALNVRGNLYFGPPSGVFVSIVPTSLAPGESADLVLNWGGTPITEWGRASGYLLYDDVAGVTWRTDYRVREDGRRFIEVVKAGKLEELGDVGYDFPPRSRS